MNLKSSFAVAIFFFWCAELEEPCDLAAKGGHCGHNDVMEDYLGEFE